MKRWFLFLLLVPLTLSAGVKEQVSQMKDIVAQARVSIEKVRTGHSRFADISSQILEWRKQLDVLAHVPKDEQRYTPFVQHHYRKSLGALKCLWDVAQSNELRILKIYYPNKSEQEIHDLFVQGHTATDELWQDQIEEQKFISEQLDAAVDFVENRHQQIKKLETQILEIHELFNDLSFLVNQQQESLDNIELHVGNAKDYTQQSVPILKKAEHYQKQCTIL